MMSATNTTRKPTVERNAMVSNTGDLSPWLIVLRTSISAGMARGPGSAEARRIPSALESICEDHPAGATAVGTKVEPKPNKQPRGTSKPQVPAPTPVEEPQPEQKPPSPEPDDSELGELKNPFPKR